MDNWFFALVRRLPPILALYAISAAALIGLARLCLPLVLTVLERDLPGSRVSEVMALLLAWVPTLFVIGFVVVILAYLYRIYRRARR